MNIELVKQIGVRAAFKGGKILRSLLDNTHEIRKKGEIDLVTEADTLAEKAIIRTIQSVFPDHSILAEESGLNEGSGDNRWIVDPLDGTTNFSHGLPVFAVSIAFEHKGELAFGIVLNPVTGELFQGAKGEGAFLNGKPALVSKTSALSECLIATGFPYNLKTIIHPLMSRFENCLVKAQGVRRMGSAALDLCYLACGRFSGFFEQNLKPWDTAAGVLIASEAGAKITDFANNNYTINKNEILATNGRIHDEMISFLELEGRNG